MRSWYRSIASMKVWAMLLCCITFGGATGGELQRSVSTSVGQTFRECAACPQMTVIPAGRYWMDGKSSNDGGDGRPVRPNQGVFGTRHLETISRPIAVARFPVTVGEFAQFASETKWASHGCYSWNGYTWTQDASLSWRMPGFVQSSRDPVVCVSYRDATAYVRWLNGKRSHEDLSPLRLQYGRYRLPSWGEAEYAANGGEDAATHAPANASRLTANYGKDDCFPCGPATSGLDKWLFTSPVGAFPANGFGLFDTAGNVFEWIDACFPVVPAPFNCFYRPARGGSWLTNAQYLAVGEFMLFEQDNRNTITGFRVERDLGP